jgi:hypothetical protein
MRWRTKPSTAFALFRSGDEQWGSPDEAGAAELPVDDLMTAAAVVSRLTHPMFGAVLAALHDAGGAGCTDRQLIDAVGDDPKATLRLCGTLIDAGVVEVVDRTNRLAPNRPPASTPRTATATSCARVSCWKRSPPASEADDVLRTRVSVRNVSLPEDGTDAFRVDLAHVDLASAVHVAPGRRPASSGRLRTPQCSCRQPPNLADLTS